MYGGVEGKTSTKKLISHFPFPLAFFSSLSFFSLSLSPPSSFSADPTDLPPTCRRRYHHQSQQNTLPHTTHAIAAAQMSDESSGDELPLAALAGSRRQSRGSVNYTEDSDEEEEFQDIEESAPEEEDINDFIASDSDDDMPLSKLKSPKSAKKTPAKKKEAPKKKESSAKKKKPVTKSKSTVSSSSSKSGCNYNAPSIELYTKCDKGKLIQSVLARWWYAYSWPSAEAISRSTPKNYTALDGFPGVYICTSGSDVGKFKDFRDHSTAPNFKNFARKPSSELQELLLKAIENQRKALRKIEGEGTSTEKNLRDLEKWASKLNCSKVRFYPGCFTVTVFHLTVCIARLLLAWLGRLIKRPRRF